MNEPRFIELLNLYVDQQLSAEEARELEVEMERNPSRRRTYHQYCRMQKACAQLFEHERSTAPASTTLTRAMVAADRKVVAFPEETTRRPGWSLGYSFATLAAVACVALVIVRQADVGTTNPDSSPTRLANTEQAFETRTLVAQPSAIATTPAAPTTGEFKPIFAAHSLRVPEKSDVFFVNVSSGDAQLLEWTHQVQLKPIPKISAMEFSLGAGPLRDSAVPAGFPMNIDDERATHMSAFQFQR
jgi:anti-sigma factor RsiW